ncbi:MAG: DUF305 domain-containing protein [Gemmatimonadota bacterium]
MKRNSAISAAAAILAMAACAGVPHTQPPAPGPVAQLPFTAADVQFMAGMIHHHEQAVLIGRWAASHGASDAIRRLSERIVVAQQDEIALARTWLRDRAQSESHAHELMPGMLTAQQLAELDRARGREFDRWFLTFMIQHHYGALTMVEKLFSSYGAAQDEAVFRFASDVFADQTTEIDRMETMLSEMESRP